MLRQFYRTDYRGIIAILADSTELRKTLQFAALPHYSTLCYAERRFAQRGFLTRS